MEGKIYNEQAEVSILNNYWELFIKSMRLKMALAFPAKVIVFLNNLRFISCEDNTENTAIFSLYPFYEEPLYQYHYLVKFRDAFHEIYYYPSNNMWCLDNVRFKDFFSVSEHVEKSVASILREFNPTLRLEKIKLECICESYKRKYLHRQVTLKDIVIRNDEFYMIFDDGTQAKIIHIQ